MMSRDQPYSADEDGVFVGGDRSFAPDQLSTNKAKTSQGGNTQKVQLVTGKCK